MTMRIDAYTHFIPTRFYNEVMSTGSHKDIGKRMMGVPSIYDVKVRLKVVDKFKDYAQILSYPMPPFEMMTQDGKQAEEYTRSSTTASPSFAPSTPTTSRAGSRRRRCRRRTSACASRRAP